jgi:hypothetical protein
LDHDLLDIEEGGQCFTASVHSNSCNTQTTHIISVANPRWVFIPDPDVCPSRIPDPKTAIKEKGEKILSYLFL